MMDERDQPGYTHCTPAGSACAAMWLCSVLLGAGGLVAAFTRFPNVKWMVPAALGVSIFGMLMFVISYGRACRAAAARVIAPPAGSVPGVLAPKLIPIEEVSAVAAAEPSPAAATAAAQSTDNAQLRKLYDRFDLKAIDRARQAGLTAKDAASFLGFARDFVDQRHALGLMAAGDEAELGRHLAASIERALLAFQSM